MVGVVDIKRGAVFIHLPKCAGSSVSRVLLASESSHSFRELPGLKEIVQRDNRAQVERIADVGHARARQVREALGSDIFDATRSFAIVRNPWSRLVSRYLYLRGTLGSHLPKHLAGTFEEFVLWVCENRPSTQFDRLVDLDGNILVSDLLSFEKLQSDFDTYSRQVFGVTYDLLKLNRSVDTTVKFSSKACEAVRSAYKIDFETFGYSDQGLHPYCGSSGQIEYNI